MRAETIAEVYVTNVISRFGAPTSLHTDQGSNFNSDLFLAVCRLLGVKKTRTTAYHPEGDGMVERFNQTLEGLLSHVVNEQGVDWDLHIPACLMAYRSSVHKSTGFTPHFLLFGREMVVPADVVYGLPPQQPRLDQPGYVRDLRTKLEAAYDLVRRRLAVEHKRQKTDYDRNSNLRSFKVDDLVYVLTPVVPPGTSRKFARFWRGPYTVLAKLSDVNYRVRDTAAPYREMVVHLNRMKRCYERFDRLRSIPEPTLDPDSSDAPPPVSACPPEYQRDATDHLYDEDGYGDSETWHLPPPLPQPPGRPVRNCGPPIRYGHHYVH